MTKIRENKVIPVKTIAVASRAAQNQAIQDMSVEDPEDAAEIIRLCGKNISNHGADIDVRNLG